MLSRRIPLPQIQQQPASALPSYLKRTPTPSSVPSRPHSPQSTNIRPGTPPPVHRPGSPLRTRPTARSHSPAIPAPTPRAITNARPLAPPPPIEASDVQVDLIIRNIPREDISIDKPFKISCTLIVSASPTMSSPSMGSKQQRILSLVVQHVQHPQPVTSSSALAVSHRVQYSGMSTPDARRDDLVYAATQKSLVASPHQDTDDVELTCLADYPLLPPPFAAPATVSSESSPACSPGVVFLGPSALFLDPIRLLDPGHSHLDTSDDDSSSETTEDNDEHFDGITKATSKVQVAREFELSYLPLCKGFSTVGGLRVLLVEDKVVNVNNDEVLPDEAAERGQGAGAQTEARILEEWGVIAEIWARS